ncbi:MAG: sulfatase [Planctomycetota bacterium]
MRRVFPVVISSALSLTSVLAVEAAEPRNVLFIAADDLACNLGCYGDRLAKTPHLDRLAASGVCFLNAYNQIPLCNPSRASVMTGLRPDTIKVYDLDRHFRDEVPDVVTLPQRFMAAGRYTARVGKIYHYNVPASIGTDGFDDPPSWEETFNPAGRDKTDERFVVNTQPHRKISASLSWLAAEGEDAEQTDGMVATRAIEMMRAHRDGLFFIAAGFFRPHTPYVAPKKYFDLYPPDAIRLPFAPAGDRDDIPVAAFAHNCPVPNYGLEPDLLREALRAYYASTSFVDAQVGRLLDAVDELGLADDTIVVFWSDHGYHLGEHDGVWQKRTLFEQGARAPLIVRVPGASGNGQVCRRVVEFLDIYPTVVDAAGLAVPGRVEGRSLVPLLDDPTAAWDGAAVTQILRPADDRLAEPVMGRSVRTERWRYTEWAEGAAGVELYDHHADPLEFENLAGSADARIDAVIERLRAILVTRASGSIPVTPFNPPRL